MMLLLLLAADDFEVAMFGMRVRDARRIGRAFAVRDENLIAHTVPQYAHAMCTLFFRERLLLFYVRTIKEVH